MKRVVVLQSSYIPWKGYFDLIAAADDFVVYDSAQYTKNDWRNRNVIKTTQGRTWLTVPVQRAPLGTPIDSIRVADPRCFAKHWTSFVQSYAKAPALHVCSPLREVFMELADERSLSLANVRLIRAISRLLRIDTRFHSARDFDLVPDRTERLVSICLQLGATHYLSGPAAREYLDVGKFEKHGLDVEWMDYSSYHEYDQLHPPFDHHVSVLDLLACVGHDAPSHLRAGRSQS